MKELLSKKYELILEIWNVFDVYFYGYREDNEIFKKKLNEAPL